MKSHAKALCKLGLEGAISRLETTLNPVLRISLIEIN